MVDYNSIPTGWCQYLQLGYIVLCTSVNKTIIIIVTTTTTIIIIIIIIIIIVIKTGAPLLGLAKYIYYSWFKHKRFQVGQNGTKQQQIRKKTETISCYKQLFDHILFV